MRRAFFFIVAIAFATTSFASIPRASVLDPAPSIATPSSETRIGVSEVLAPFEHPAESELTRALRQAYEQASTTNASGLGRFLSVDPVLDIKKNLSEPQMWNRYAYVTNNPLKFTDPDGRYRTFYNEKPMHTMGNDAPPVIAAALTAPVAVLGVGIALEGLSYAALTAAVRYPVLFSAAMTWLQCETGTVGRWGVNTYRRGGTMTTIEHINYRHGFDSGFSNVSRFAKDTSVRDIKGYVETALKYGKATTNRGSVTVVQDLGKVIGRRFTDEVQQPLP